MARVRIVVPCYNEANRLSPAAFDAFELPGHELSYLFVDDGSTDATAARVGRMVEAQPQRYGLLRLPRNVGKAEAVRQGMLHLVDGDSDYVGFWDADLATPLCELSRFVSRLEEDPQRLLAMGARVRLLGREIERRLYRHVYGRLFATAVSRMLSLPIYDSQCGAKLFRVGDELRFALARPFLSRWIFDVEMLARLAQFTLGATPDLAERIYEVPLRQWHDVAGSKVRASDALREIRELGSIGVRYREALSSRRSGS